MDTNTIPDSIAPTLAAMRERNGFHLAADAECSSPDNAFDSAGARMLLHVRDAVIEAIEYDPDETDHADQCSEIADGAPDVYTHTKWAEFVDLGAYNEDPTDLGHDGSDMDRAASICLYIIAERLAGALFAEIEEAREADPEYIDEA